MIYYICYEVFDLKWIKFEENLKNVTKFEEILILHDNFLEECMKESLLLE